MIEIVKRPFQFDYHTFCRKVYVIIVFATNELLLFYLLKYTINI